MSVPSISANQNLRPKNSSRAKAKAVSEHAARLPITHRIETMNELRKNTSKLRLSPNQPLM